MFRLRCHLRCQSVPFVSDEKGQGSGEIRLIEVGTGQIKAMVGTRNAKGEKLFNVMIKYVAPVFVVLILVFYVLNTIGIVSL